MYKTIILERIQIKTLEICAYFLLITSIKTETRCVCESQMPNVQ